MLFHQTDWVRVGACFGYLSSASRYPVVIVVQAHPLKLIKMAVVIRSNGRLLMSFLSDDILCYVANFFDISSLLRLSECNRKFCHAASQNFDGPPGTAEDCDWTPWDPWWTRQDARRLVFLCNGSVLQVHPRGASKFAIVGRERLPGWRRGACP